MLMKNEIRQSNKLLRSQLAEEEVKQKSKAASDLFLKSHLYRDCKCIMLYMPLGKETDTSYILKSAFADGKRVVFPVTAGETGEITPHYAEKDTDFRIGAFSVYEPVGGVSAGLESIDVILVPGIAFSKAGERIGFGKGCYDRLLKSTRAVKVGYCYNFQISDSLPTDNHDIKMDYIVSEKGIIECNNR